MVDKGENGIEDKGCQDLCKLESIGIETVKLRRHFSPNINRISVAGRRCLEEKVDELIVGALQLENENEDDYS